MVTDRNHNPLAVALSSGAAHDSAYFEEVIKKVSFRQAKGRPRNKPDEITADKGYDAGRIRKELRRRGIRAMIPEKALRPGTKRRKKGPHPRFDKQVYKERGKIEQAIGWLKEYRRLATRYDKTASSFMAIIQLAIIKYFFKKYSSDTA